MRKPDCLRKHPRYAIDSPVTVGLQKSSNGDSWLFGILRDIGIHGARFLLNHSLPVGTSVTLLTHFADHHGRRVVLKFEAVVARINKYSPCELTVRFRKGPEMFRGNLEDIVDRLQQTSASENAEKSGQY